MFVALGVALAFIGFAPTYLLVGSSRRRRNAARDPLTGVFQPDELRELDAHLDEIAKEELRRLDANLVRYVAGEVGHVVTIWDSLYGIALGLSDGRRIALGGVSRVSRRLLIRRAAQDKLRLIRVERDGISYRVVLRGEVGAEIEIYTSRIAVAP
jgi:hypothetical protein